VPVLLYHHLGNDGKDGATITPAQFEENMLALYEAGYTAISIGQLVDFVYRGVDLPVKPILITFDDGYYSNYEYAYPVLKQYGFKATIFIIGVSFGKDTYKDTGRSIFPHFGRVEALEMVQSGLISIQSHTYDMHQNAKYDDPCRVGLLRNEGETETVYMRVFRDDMAQFTDLIADIGLDPVFALAFPYGEREILADVLLSEMGITVTFTIKSGTNTIIKGLPQSLLGLKRYSVGPETTGDALISRIETAG
jgi:peptidoglycan/xylan/chitin deacetylase (PgdA/CDA1 family)